MKKIVLAVPVLLGLALFILFSNDDSANNSQLSGQKRSADVFSPEETLENLSNPSEKIKEEIVELPENKSIEANPKLKRYQLIRKKALLNDEEKQELKAITEDEALVAELGNQLTTDYLLENQLQFSALDLMFQALEGGSPAAERAFKDILKNDFIEDVNNSITERKAYAGLKAEILYRWAATSPDRTSEMVALLPGPVSRKIWSNVKRTHQLNKRESQRSS